MLLSHSSLEGFKQVVMHHHLMSSLRRTSIIFLKVLKVLELIVLHSTTKIVCLRWKDFWTIYVFPTSHGNNGISMTWNTGNKHTTHALQSVIMIIAFCGRQNIALWGHRETGDSSNSGVASSTRTGVRRNQSYRFPQNWLRESQSNFETSLRMKQWKPLLCSCNLANSDENG